MPENVLCVTRNNIPARFTKSHSAEAVSWKEISSHLYKSNPIFLPRTRVETNKNYKQLIPYILISNIKGEYLCYKRAGSEERLKGKYSVGIGGHINETDQGEKTEINEPNGLEQTIMQGFLRELHEETGIENIEISPSIEDNFLGTINEEESPVGEVHLGLVLHYRLSPHSTLHLGEELSQACWLPRKNMNGYMQYFELWSKLALDLVKTR